MKKKLVFSLITAIALTVLSSTFVFAEGNETNNSFNKAKKMLERVVYANESNRVTIYCKAEFDENKNIFLPQGFRTTKHINRANRVEWEHVVPAENFGRTFSEWRDGDPLCINSKGKRFKGRRCAEKMNNEYRLMQSDMYNLYPAIGAVNATRSNYNFTMLAKNTPSTFGSCQMKIEGCKVEPPLDARGKIARAYLYMDSEYKRYNMSDAQRKLMNAWNKMFPVTEQECSRTKKIEKLQGNENTIVKRQCLDAGLWDSEKYVPQL